MSLRLSIIICTLNREQVLCRTVEAVAALLRDREDAELLIVDQTRQHEPATEALLASLTPPVQWLRVDFASLTRARNFGIRHARGEIVLFLDDDVEPVPHLLDAHLQAYDDPAVSAVGGGVLLPGQRPVSRGELSQAEHARLESGRANRFDLDWSRFMRWAPGCNMSFRREKLFQVGGFDEAFYGMAIGEEAELCHRLMQQGDRLRFVPEAQVLHLVNATGGCRDARQEAERVAQLLDNGCYYHRRIGDSPWRIVSVLAKQCFRIVISRASLREGTWGVKMRACVFGLARALRSWGRQPQHGLLEREENRYGQRGA